MMHITLAHENTHSTHNL